ncbi:MAG TPA: GLPGLI family protein [Anditalea sp.]|nr:GLPGLI family protein [Anditalea sp.]
MFNRKKEKLGLHLFIFLQFTFCFLQIQCTYGQKSIYGFFYDVKAVIDTSDHKIKTSDYMVLWSNEKYSVFQSYYGFENDNFKRVLSQKIDETGVIDATGFINEMKTRKKESFTYKIHKNKSKKLISFHDKLFSDFYKYDQDLGKLKWIIHSDEKDVLNMPAIRATTTYAGRNYIAWFTEKIPINDGPYIFHGLPGLIVELYDEEEHYYFVLKEIEKREVEMSVIVPRKSIQVSRSEFLKTKRKHFANVALGLPPHILSNMNAQQLKNLQERYDRANNPLELNVEDEF